MPKTLLLADDSVTIQKVVGISLANEDIRLVTVDNGDDAISRAREIQPDIVLADIVMPGKTGYEVCEAIKNDPALSQTPVLLLTGTFEAFDVERATQAGSDGQLTKPFEAETLVDTVNQLLAQTRGGTAPAADAAPADAILDAGDPILDAAEADPILAPVEADAIAPDPSTPLGEAGSFDFFDEDVSQTGLAPYSPPAENSNADALEPLADADFLVPADADSPAPATTILDEPTAPAEVEAEPLEAIAEPADELDAGGFDLESADLSMSSSVPEADAILEPDPVLEPEPFVEPEPVTEAEPVTAAANRDDPLAEIVSDENLRGRVMDPYGAESFSVHSAEYEPESPAEAPAAAPEPFASEEPAFTPTAPDAAPEPAAELGSASAHAAPDISPALRDQIHETLEKIAWEAFSDLSDTIVRQALERIEAIAWEVVPQMAEAAIKEEIARMTREDGEK